MENQFKATFFSSLVPTHLFRNPRIGLKVKSTIKTLYSSSHAKFGAKFTDFQIDKHQTLIVLQIASLNFVAEKLSPIYALFSMRKTTLLPKKIEKCYNN